MPHPEKESRRFDHAGEAWAFYRDAKRAGRNPRPPMGGPGTGPGWYVIYDREPNPAPAPTEAPK